MKWGKIQSRACALLAMAAYLAVFAGGALAEDGFVSRAGRFNWLRAPALLPGRDVAPSDGWVGLFYASGCGLEMNIWDEGDEYLHWSLKNYNNPYESGSASMVTCMRPVDGGWQDTEGSFALRDLGDGSFTMTPSPEWIEWMRRIGSPLYGEPESIVFTDVTRLLANPAEDRYSGAYFHDVMADYGGTEVYDDTTLYLSVMQLYGTGDYYVVSQSEHAGQEVTDAIWPQFFTEVNGGLECNHGESIVTGADYIQRLEVDESDPQRILRLSANEGDGTVWDYYWCSTGTMWGD